MDIKITNSTGKTLYYKILDSEGPYARFDEEALPGMFPWGQNSNYTDSDNFLDNLDTKVGNQRKTLMSRYPKFNSPQDYMMNFRLGQQPSRRSYAELQNNYPEQYLGNRKLDGNIEGMIPLGLHRDIMLPDLNCNIYMRTIGKPILGPTKSTAHFDLLEGASELFDGSKGKIYDGDPRLLDYECTIKAARLRENHVISVIQQNNKYHGYTSAGVEYRTEFPQDISVIALQAIHHQKSANPFLANKRQFDGRYYRYPYASVDTLPMTQGTYIDSLREDEKARKKSYSNKYVDMTNSNYSDDYDDPILGYFDRRYLYRRPYDHQ
jgi:hypothetical protein